jgi:hypothetical protein
VTPTACTATLAGMTTFQIFLSIGILIEGVLTIYFFREVRRGIAELREINARFKDVFHPSPEQAGLNLDAKNDREK